MRTSFFFTRTGLTTGGAIRDIWDLPGGAADLGCPGRSTSLAIIAPIPTSFLVLLFLASHEQDRHNNYDDQECHEYHEDDVFERAFF